MLVDTEFRKAQHLADEFLLQIPFLREVKREETQRLRQSSSNQRVIFGAPKPDIIKPPSFLKDESKEDFAIESSLSRI